METPLDNGAREKEKTLQDYIEAGRSNEGETPGSLLSERKMAGLGREAARTAISQGPPSGDDIVTDRLGQRLDRHKENLKKLSHMATGKQLAGLEETPDKRGRETE